ATLVAALEVEPPRFAFLRTVLAARGTDSAAHDRVAEARHGGCVPGGVPSGATRHGISSQRGAGYRRARTSTGVDEEPAPFNDPRASEAARLVGGDRRVGHGDLRRVHEEHR